MPASPSDLELRRVGYDHPDAVHLVERVQEFYVSRYGGRDDDPADPAEFLPPTGSFFVGYLAEAPDVPVAMGGWRGVGEDRLATTRTAEIKRMYVVPEAQRRGLARRVLSHLEVTAAQAGYEALLLSTGILQHEAVALYEACGYELVEGFGFYAGGPYNRCYGKRL